MNTYSRKLKSEDIAFTKAVDLLTPEERERVVDMSDKELEEFYLTVVKPRLLSKV